MTKFLRKIAVTLLILSFAMSASACKSKPAVAPAPALLPPTIKSYVMNIRTRNNSQLEWYIAVNLENPNTVELPAPRLNFVYKINESVFLRGGHQTRHHLRAASGGASTATLAEFGISTVYNDVYRIIPASIRADALPCQVEVSFVFPDQLFEGETISVKIDAVLPMPGY
jgi:hypothetical protein